MQLYTADRDGRVLVWLVDEPVDLPALPGLEWMTPEQPNEPRSGACAADAENRGT